jgi:hypothetical protein
MHRSAVAAMNTVYQHVSFRRVAVLEAERQRCFDNAVEITAAHRNDYSTRQSAGSRVGILGMHVHRHASDDSVLCANLVEEPMHTLDYPGFLTKGLAKSRRIWHN